MHPKIPKRFQLIPKIQTEEPPLRACLCNDTKEESEMHGRRGGTAEKIPKDFPQKVCLQLGRAQTCPKSTHHKQNSTSWVSHQMTRYQSDKKKTATTTSDGKEKGIQDLVVIEELHRLHAMQVMD